MNLELWVARRLSLKAPGIAIAVSGIALSVAVMLVSIAVVGGFKGQVAAKVVGFEHQVSVYPAGADAENGTGVRLTPKLADKIRQAAPGASVSLGLRQPGILKTDSDFAGIVMRGVGADGNRFIESQIVDGTMPDMTAAERNPVVISQSTASALRLGVGDRPMAHFFIGDNLYSRRVTVAGIYNPHFGEYDKLNVFAPLSMLQQLCKVDSLTGSSVDIDGVGSDPDLVAANLRNALYADELAEGPDAPRYQVESVTKAGALYFSWLGLLDTNVAVILILMGCVAGFTLVSCLFIIVLERVRMIGLLKALGATDTSIRGIFILMAVRLVGRGLLAGNAVALALLLLQERTHILPLDPDAYYLDYVPVDINWLAVAALNAAAVAVSFALLILPSHIIATLSPAETMRYE